MQPLVLILFNLFNTTRQPNVEPTVRHHDTVVKTTDRIVQKVLTATPTEQPLKQYVVTFNNVQVAI